MYFGHTQQHPPLRLMVYYVTMLSALTLLTIIDQVQVQDALTKQSNYSSIVNISGRRRILSKKMHIEVMMIIQTILQNGVSFVMKEGNF